MKISAEDLTARYRGMADEELLSIDRADLTDLARQCYDHEFERRKLDPRLVAGAPRLRSEPAGSAEQGAEGLWACAGAFPTADEAQAVCGLLESAGLPVRLDDSPGDLLWFGPSTFPSRRVLVPESMLDDALGLIESHATEQELVARAAADPGPVTIRARYEDGVFKPVDPVELEEGTEIHIQLPPTPSAPRS